MSRRWIRRPPVDPYPKYDELAKYPWEAHFYDQHSLAEDTGSYYVPDLPRPRVYSAAALAVLAGDKDQS